MSLLHQTRQMLICRLAARDGFVSWATQGSLCAETDDIATRLPSNKSPLPENLPPSTISYSPDQQIITQRWSNQTNTWRGSEPNLSTKRKSHLYFLYTILTIQTRHQEIRSCQTTARSQEIRKTDSSSKDQTEGDGQEIFPGQGTGCQEEYVLSILPLLTSLTRQRGAREQSLETNSILILIIPRISLSEVVLRHEAHEEGVARQV